MEYFVYIICFIDIYPSVLCRAFLIRDRTDASVARPTHKFVLCRFCVRAFVPAILAEHWNRIPTVSHHHQPRPPVPPVGLEGPGLAFHFICPSLFSRRCHLRSLPFRRYTRLCARRISQETHTGVYDQWCAGNLSVYTTWDSLLKTPVMNGQ